MSNTKTQAESVRRQVTFRGEVQGVGFRYTACQVAADFPVAGYVQNLPGGEVEVVVEGEAAAVAAFVDRLSDRMARYIADTKSSDSPARGEFEQFEVRF